MERNILTELTIAAKRFREGAPEDRALYLLAVDRLLDEYGVVPPIIATNLPPSAEGQRHLGGQGRE